MAEIEKIRGAAVVKLLTELKQHKIPLSIRWTADDEDYSAYITDIRKRRRTLHFLVKPEENFFDFGEPDHPSRLTFEFIDRENIKYVFDTDAAEFSQTMAWIAFPEFICRFQRRSLFRLEAPHGTRLYFTVNEARYKLLVVNVSLGGTLGVLVSLTRRMEQELAAYKSEILENAELVFPPRNKAEQGSTVRIKRWRLIRQERNPLTQKLECAVQFKEIEEAEQKKLTQLFYRWQREYLRRRKLMRA
jgi:c-di-GMP-binding flagellar brake protein YcgR